MSAITVRIENKAFKQRFYENIEKLNRRTSGFWQFFLATFFYNEQLSSILRAQLGQAYTKKMK